MSRFDISAARRLLGFEPAIDLRTGLAELAGLALPTPVEAPRAARRIS